MPLFQKQQEYLEAFESKKYRYLLYGGSWRSGKSMLTIGIIHDLAIGYENTRYAIVRKNLTTLKRTSVKTYEDILYMNKDHRFIKSFNRSELYVTYKNGSEIYFFEADVTKDPELNKLRGTEFTGSLLEEANELDVKVFHVMKGRIGQRNNNILGGYDFMLLNCNPSEGWVKDTFYEPWESNNLKAPYYFLPALPTDNPHLTKQYLKGLEDLPENEYKRFVLGQWDYGTDEGQLVPGQWIKDKQVDKFEILKRYDKHKRTVLGVDPARTGKDKTLFTFIHEDMIWFEEINSDNTATIAGFVIERMKEFNIQQNDVVIDVVGLGAGVVDTLLIKEIKIIAFNGGEKPQTRAEYFYFKNKRTEAYWLVREAFEKSDIVIENNPELFKQLCITKYEIKDKFIQIESKDKIKQKLNGASPDYADSLTYAFYAYKKVTKSIPKQFNIRKTYTNELNY